MDQFNALNEDDYISQFLSGHHQSYDYQCDDSHLKNDNQCQQQILLHEPKDQTSQYQQSQTQKIIKISSSRKKSSTQATVKYRQRKKKYIQELEDTVRKLDEEISETDKLIKVKKDQILIKLQSLANRKLQNNDNAQVYNELQQIINLGKQQEYLVDVDKINLLIDTLKYRIGPTGRQRQAKIEYHFKNIINTLLPALHRYLMKSAAQKFDMFQQQPNNKLQWTQKLFQQVNLTSIQKEKINRLKMKLAQSLGESKKDIGTLYCLKKQLKQKQIMVENIQQQIRDILSPIQSAKWILYCQKHKYKKQCCLQFDTNHLKSFQQQFFATQKCQIGACRKLVKKY